jgi:cyclophilin family peptidyl-prolyl cis-trans isomerase
MLADRDNGLRLGAIEGLAAAPQAEDLPLLEAAWVTSTGDIAPEVRVRALAVAGEIGGDAAIDLLRRGLATGGTHERRVAREALARLVPAEELPPLGAPARLSVPPLPSPPAERLTVEVVTSRGSLVFDLLPDEAPRHVRNFLELAKRDHYDGLSFHRVVADFVVQGGDYRGDGNGSETFDGAPLPAEFGPRKFVRGSLGMPRNDDPDSGGSQFFVTHRPTPHLEGRYTQFGQLRQGFDVLDSLEVGDRIFDVRVRGAVQP